MKLFEATEDKYPELIGEGHIRGYDVTNMQYCSHCGEMLDEQNRTWIWYMDSMYWYLQPVSKACRELMVAEVDRYEDPPMRVIARSAYADPTDDDARFEWSDGLDVEGR